MADAHMQPCRSGHTDCTVDCGWCKGTGYMRPTTACGWTVTGTLSDRLYVVTWTPRDDDRPALVYDEDEGDAAAFVSLLDAERYVARRAEECPDFRYEVVPFHAVNAT